MEAPGEARRQTRTAQGPLHQAHQIQVTQQGQGPCFGKAEAQALHTLTGWRPLGARLRNLRRSHHHVVPQLGATDTAAAAALKGAVRHHRSSQGIAQVLGQPGFLDP